MRDGIHLVVENERERRHLAERRFAAEYSREEEIRAERAKLLHAALFLMLVAASIACVLFSVT